MLRWKFTFRWLIYRFIGKQSVKQPRFSLGQLWSVRPRKHRWSRMQSRVSRREKRSSYTKRSTRDSTHFQMPTEDYMRWNGRTVHATKTVSLSLSLQRYDRAFWKTCSWTVHDHEPSHGFYLWCTWPPNHSVEWHYTESQIAWTICHCHHRKRSSSRQLFWLCWWYRTTDLQTRRYAENRLQWAQESTCSQVSVGCHT